MKPRGRENEENQGENVNPRQIVRRGNRDISSNINDNHDDEHLWQEDNIFNLVEDVAIKMRLYLRWLKFFKEPKHMMKLKGRKFPRYDKDMLGHKIIHRLWDEYKKRRKEELRQAIEAMRREQRRQQRRQQRRRNKRPRLGTLHENNLNQERRS